MAKKINIWALAYTIVLVLFTAYAALDTFVIPRAYVVLDSETTRTAPQEINAFPDKVQAVGPETDTGGYTDSNTEEGADSGAVNGKDAKKNENISTDEIEKTETNININPVTETTAEADEEIIPESDAAEPDTNTGADTYKDTGKETETIADTTESTEINTGADPDTEIFSDPEITSSSYVDENISITITGYREKETEIYVAEITLSGAEYLKTAFAHNTYGKNVKAATSVIAAEHNANFAIDGDFYGARNHGYVIRNGTIYRDASNNPKQEDLVIYGDGSFAIITEGSVTPKELLEDGAFQVLSFGPGLIDNGEITVTADDEVAIASASNPRTAIGIIDDLHYIMVVSDGRTKESAGLTLLDLADFMLRLGVVTAYNLDGGGSATMYFNGKIINKPTETGRSINERKVSDIVYIGY